MSALAPQAEAQPISSVPRRLLRAAAACALIAVCAAILALATTSGNAANRDFVAYWAAGQAIAHRANPYDASAVFAMEKAAGLHAARPLIMRNPPFALLLTIPLGFVSAKTGAVLWSLLILGCLMAAIRLLRDIFGRPRNRLHLVGYLFAPALACLLAGQTSVFALLGLTLFLRFHRTRPLPAGAALFLCALKPHLFLPFAVVLLAWAVSRKAYGMLAGALLALGAGCAVPLLLDRSVWTQYSGMARTAGIEREFIPNLSALLRIAIDRHAAWLQFLPALAACVWAFWYFRRHRVDWDWRTQGALLMLVSVLAAPYSWFTDEVALLPAILQGIYLASERSLRWFGALAGVALLQVLFGVPMPSGLYIWTPVAWLAWYLYATRVAGADTTRRRGVS